MSEAAKSTCSDPTVRRYRNAHGILVRRVQFPESRLVFYIDRIPWIGERYDWWPRFGAQLIRLPCPSLSRAIRAVRLIDHLARSRSELEDRDG